MKISSTFTNDHGVPFVAVRLDEGEPYGRLMPGFQRLTAKSPTIEFYDARYPGFDGCEHGQFVSRYYAETLAHKDVCFTKDIGLRLDSGVGDWHVSAENMRLVHRQLITNADRAAAVAAVKRGEWL